MHSTVCHFVAIRRVPVVLVQCGHYTLADLFQRFGFFVVVFVITIHLTRADHLPGFLGLDRSEHLRGPFAVAFRGDRP